MYSNTWSIGANGAPPQSLSIPAFDFPNTSIPPDSDFTPHTVYVKNSHSSVPLFVGQKTPDGGALTSCGWRLNPGETFQITLNRDQLWVAAGGTQDGQVTFITVRN